MLVLSGECSSCGHRQDPIEFRTQFDAWVAALNAPTLDPERAPKKKAAKRATKKASKKVREPEPELASGDVE